MYDMIEGVAGPIVRGEFRHEKSPCEVVMNNMRAKRRGEHVIQSLLIELVGGSLGWFLLAWRTAWCGKTFCTMGVTKGSGCAPQVIATGGLVFPGSCGPSLASIASDNWGLLSRCLFDKRRVESELSS